MPAETSSSVARRLRRRIAAMVTLAVTASAFAFSSGTAEAAPVYYSGAGSAPRISVIGDSSNAGVRWMNTFEPLRQFNYTFDSESCRRTLAPSCRGREGTPDTSVQAMRRLQGQLGEVLVMVTGYNDPGSGFAAAVDAVMAEAQRQRIPNVVWLTMRTADVTYVGPGYASNASTFRDNNRILLQKAAQYGGRLHVADWATYSANRRDWVTSDGIHLTRAGGYAVTAFIADQAARVLAGQNVTPLPGNVPIFPWLSMGSGARGVSVAVVQHALAERGYNVGVDGVFGSVTDAAIRRFQRANGLPATGAVDPRTANALGINNAGGTAAPAQWTGLRYAMGGLAVAEAQSLLTAAGVFVRGGVTGVFDVYTTYAVQTYQRFRGITASGVLDEQTARELGIHSGEWVQLRLGMSGARVRSLQQALIAGGIHVAEGANGSFGVGTFYAVQTFQRFHRLRVTGVVDAATARALGLIDSPAPSAVWSGLMFGASGPRVTIAQQKLIDAGIFVRGGASGNFDIYTTYAVNTFQRQNGLRVTGIINVATARRLGLFNRNDPVSTWQNITLGSTGPTVGRAEQALIRAGVYVRDGVDRVFGLGDFYAVMTFQRYNGLPVTGRIDLATARRLGILNAPTPLASTAVVSVSASALSAPASAETEQIDTEPVDSDPVDSQPANSEPANSGPTNSEPVDSEPVDSEPANSEPANSEPANSEPVDSEPVDSEPADSEPVGSDPVETEPIETEPIDTEPAATEAPATGRIEGTVWLDNGDGIYTDDEPGHADIELNLRDATGATIATAITDRDGTFTFTDLVPGSYLVEADPDALEQHHATVEVPAGDTAWDDPLVVGDDTTWTIDDIELPLVAAAQPTPTEPAEPAPTEPATTAPAPTEPAATQPAPAPTEPASEPEPTPAPETTAPAPAPTDPPPPATDPPAPDDDE